MPDFQIKVEALTKEATDKFKELGDTAEEATQDRKIKVTAELKPASQVLEELSKSADEAAKERKLKIDTSAIEKSINSLKSINLKEINDGFDDIKVAGERVGKTVQMVYKALKTQESMTPGFGPIQASEDLAKATLKAAKATPQVTAALIEGSKAGNILSASFNVAANSAVTLVDNMARIGFSLFAVKQTIGVLQSAFKGLFDETIGREIQFRETILKTQTTMASTSRVFKNGKEITQPYEKIVALTGAIEDRIRSIEERSVDLAGVTSNEVVEVFNVVSSQIGRIGGDLKDAEDLAISFASALGTFGIPLYQARQEITSMMMGQVTSDSYLATALNIKSADIAKAKTQTGGVIKFIQDKLESAVAGQKIAAQGFSGITSNIRDLQEIISKSFGAGMLNPLLTGLTRVYKFLSSIKDTLKDIAKYSGEAIGKLVSTNLNLIFGGSDLFKGVGPSTEKLATSILYSINKVTQSLQADINHLVGPLKTIFEELAKSILLITNGLAGLAKGFVDMKFNQFAALLTIIESLIPAITGLSAGLGELLKLYGNLLQTPIVSTFARVRAELELLDRLGLTNITQFVFVGAMLIRAWQPVGVFFKNLAVKIASILSEILAKVSVVVTKIATLVKSLVNSLSDASSGITNALSEGLQVTPSQELATAPQQESSEPSDVASKKITESLGNNLIDPQVNKMVDSMREIKSSFTNTAGPAVDKLKGKIVDLGNSFISVSPQSNKFKNALENLGDTAQRTGTSLFSRLKQRIKPSQGPTDVQGAVRDSVQSTFVNPAVTNMTDSLRESVNKATPVVGGLRSKLKDLASGFTTAIPSSQGFIDTIKRITATTIESQSTLGKFKETINNLKPKTQTSEQTVEVSTNFTAVPRLSPEQRLAAEKELATPAVDTQLPIPGLDGMANSAEMLSKVKSAAQETQLSLRQGLVDVLSSVSTGLNKVSVDAANTARTLSSFKLIAAATGQVAGKAIQTMLNGFVQMVKANIYLMAINFVLTRLIVLFGAFNRKKEEIARSKRAEEALVELQTKFKDVGESADEATKVQKEYLESLVSAEYDAAADKLNKLDETLRKMQGRNIFERSFDTLKGFLKELAKLAKLLAGDLFAPLSLDFWTLDGKERKKKQEAANRSAQDTEVFGFDIRNITDIAGRHSKDGWFARKKQAERDATAEQLRRLGSVKNQADGTNNDNITTEPNPVSQTELLKKRQELEREMAERRRAFEEDIFDFRKQQEDVVFERRQAIAQKEIDIFRASGELRIAQMERSNAKALEGEEGASRAALEALNTYLSEREKGELDIEAQKKEVSLEVVKVERALADYKLSQERRIAEIRRAADKYALDVAKARAEYAAMSAANSVGDGGSSAASSSVGIGTGAFDTGLKTGPAHVIGGSAAYHQDMAFGDGVGIKQQVALVRQMAEAYDKIGRKMMLSNDGVYKQVFPLKGSEEEQTKWVTDARKAHRARNGGTGRDAIDFYTPTKNEDMWGKSVENTPMLAPTIPGAKKEYFSGGAAGAGIRLMVDGKAVFGLMHGRTDIPLPSNGVIPKASPASTATPSAPVLPQPAGSTGRPSVSSGISPERQALLDTIRYAEGTWKGGSQEGYRVMYGGGLAPDLKKHPDRVVRTSLNASAAAGAYQFMPATWQEQSSKLGLSDFGPVSQDKAALSLLSKRGALGLADQGQFTRTLAAKLAPEWASFPTASGASAYERQSVKKFDDLKAFYDKQLAIRRGGGGPTSSATGTIGEPNLPALPDFSKIGDSGHIAAVAELDRAMQSAGEKLQNLRVQLQGITNETNFENIGKAFEEALPGKESFDDLEDGLYKTKLTIQAVAESVDQAYDPEHAGLLIEHQGHLNTLQREFQQIIDKIAAKTDLDGKKKIEIQEMLNKVSDAYIQRQEKILSYKKQQLAAERALAYIQETATRTRDLDKQTKNVQDISRMQFSGMRQEDINLATDIAAMRAEYEEKVGKLNDINPTAKAISASFVDTSFDTNTYTSPIAVAKPATPSPTPIATVPTATTSPITVKPASTTAPAKPVTASTSTPASPTADAITAITSSIKSSVGETQAVLTAFAATAESTLGPSLTGSVTDLFTVAVNFGDAYKGMLSDITSSSQSFIDATGGTADMAEAHLNKQIEARIRLAEAEKAAQDPVNNMLGQWRREIADTRGQITSLGSTIQSELSTAMSTSITGVIQGTTTVKEAFGSMFQNIGDTFIKMAMDTLSKAVVGDFMQMLFGAAGGGMGGMGGAGGAGGMLGGLFSGLFGGARAAGGNAAYGRPLLVGERGPEIFVPPATGQIIPNHRSQGVLGQMNQAMTALPEYAPLQKGGIRAQAPDPFSSNRRALDDVASLQRERSIEKAMASVGGTTEIKYSRVNSGDLPFITEDDAKEMAKQAELNGAKMGQQRTLAALRNNPRTRGQIGI